jgi:hypothetical protein
MRDKTSKLLAEFKCELSLAYGLSISWVFVRERDWLNEQTPFLINAREETVPA